MTFSIGRVAGGTNAGRRRVRDVKRYPWQCACPAACVKCKRHGPAGWCDLRTNDARLTRCPDCGVPRPS